MARSFLRQALYRLGGVERAIGDRQYAIAVRWSQEAVELYGEADGRRASADATFVVDHVREALQTDESS